MSDRMLSDEILLGLIKKNGGGGGGTTNYNNLENLPQIGGVTLRGNKTASDLGLATENALANKVDKVEGKGLSTNDFTDTEKAQVATNTEDIDSLKSGLTNLADDVKLNTQDLTTPSRTKNLLPMTIERIKALNTSGTWRGNTYNINNGNIVFTVNSQGSITNILIDGQFNNNTLRVKLGSVTADKDLILNGYTGNWDSAGVTLYANEAETTTPEYSTGTSGFVTLVSGKVYEFFISFSLGSKNANLNPMVRYATITDPTFAPYIPSVESRIEAVESGLTNLSTVSNITSQFTVDDTKVAYFRAYRCGNNVNMVVRTGSGQHASGETLVIIPVGLRPIEGMYSTLFNWSDDSLISTATAYISPSDGTIKNNGAYNAIAFMQFSYVIGN